MLYAYYPQCCDSEVGDAIPSHSAHQEGKVLAMPPMPTTTDSSYSLSLSYSTMPPKCRKYSFALYLRKTQNDIGVMLADHVRPRMDVC